jgi:hypothetical protein
MDRALWWDGAASALIGALVGSAVPLFSAWNSRRVERRGEISAMQVEMYHANLAMQALISEDDQAPTFRIPLTMFELALPKLIGEGRLTDSETSALVEYVARMEELNRGLDRAGQAAAMDQTVPTIMEFHRNRARASRILDEKLPRLKDRAVFQATFDTLHRLEGALGEGWKTKLGSFLKRRRPSTAGGPAA